MLDCGIASVALVTAFARRRAAAPERFVIGGQVPDLAGGGAAHAPKLTRWIHEMNPLPDLCYGAPIPYSVRNRFAISGALALI